MRKQKRMYEGICILESDPTSREREIRYQVDADLVDGVGYTYSNHKVNYLQTFIGESKFKITNFEDEVTIIKEELKAKVDR